MPFESLSKPIQFYAGRRCPVVAQGPKLSASAAADVEDVPTLSIKSSVARFFRQPIGLFEELSTAQLLYEILLPRRELLFLSPVRKLVRIPKRASRLHRMNCLSLLVNRILRDDDDEESQRTCSNNEQELR